MASPCTNDPNEVISAVVGIQTAEENFERALDDAVDTATENADKFNLFVNGTDTQTVQLGEGAATPTIRNAVRQMMSAAAALPSADVSGKSATANGGAEMRTLADRFADIVNVKDFGAKGDGTTDDTTAINAAMTAAAGKALFFPAGTYLTKTGLAIPSNTEVHGAGMWSTVIKLHDDAPFANHCVRNSENVWDRSEAVCTDNHGNENIVLKDIAVDGNGWVITQQTGVNHRGCAIQFAYVKNLLIKNVRAFNGCLHCLDISSASYADNDGPEDEGWYYGASENVYIENAVCYDSKGDDALTTHWSHDITIVNPLIYRTASHPLYSSTTHGLEIDDGSYRVYVKNGHVSDYNCGLQIKGHGTNVYFPAHDVTVDGLVCEGNALNFWITHAQTYKKEDTPDAEPLRNISLYNCKSIKACLPPKESDSSYYQGDLVSDLFLSDVCGCTVQDFLIVGDGETDKGDYVVRPTGNSENITLNNIQVYDCPGTDSVVYITENTGIGIKINNIVVRNCGSRKVAYFGGPNGYCEVDGVDASRTAVPGDDIPLFLVLFGGSIPGENSFSIKNIYNSTGFSRVIGERVSGSYGNLKITQSKKCEASFTNKTEIKWIRAKGQGGNSGDPTRVLSLGYATGTQNIGVGEGTAIGFVFKATSDDAAEVAYVGSWKNVSGPDSDLAHALVFASRDTSDTGYKATVRWLIAPSGHFLPKASNTYNIGASNATVANLYTQSGNVQSSDARVKDNVTSVGDAIMRAWGKVNFKVFQFIDAIDAKGADKARLHVGVIAQEVKTAFESDGLDVNRYGLFCHDAWDAVLDENGVEIEPSGDRYAIRYDEALALECAYQRWLGEKRDARIAELEARLNEISDNGSAPSGASPDNL